MTERESPATEVGISEAWQATDVPASIRAQDAWSSQRPRDWRYPLLRRMLACADFAAAFAASLALIGVGTGNTSQVAWALILLPMWIVVAKVLGLYEVDTRTPRHLTVDEIPRLVVWAVLGVSSLSLLLEVSPAGQPAARSGVIAGIVATVSVIVLRATARLLWRGVTPPERILLIGTPEAAVSIQRKLQLFPDLHMRVTEERVMSEPDEWTDVVARADLDRIVFAPAALDERETRGLVDACRSVGLALSIVPPCRTAFGSATQLQHVAELPLLHVRTAGLSRSTLLLKRVMDVAVGAVVLVLLLPVFVVVAVAIKVDSRGPVFFRQLRAGRDGRPFRMLKFRTMVWNAEELLPSLISFDTLEEPVFKLKSDPRVTRVGRSLRRWSLDELPQLWNVLVGEMSLVGPRPEQIELVDLYTPEQRIRLEVKPGITGPMQVYGRGELSFEERLAVESDYIATLTVGRDLTILARTFGVVVGGHGAR